MQGRCVFSLYMPGFFTGISFGTVCQWYHGGFHLGTLFTLAKEDQKHNHYLTAGLPLLDTYPWLKALLTPHPRLVQLFPSNTEVVNKG